VDDHRKGRAARAERIGACRRGTVDPNTTGLRLED
jgi:hypothetical protein